MSTAFGWVIMIRVATILLSFSIGCMVGEEGALPTAPSELRAEPGSGGGVHLTWVDNSTDEMHFMVIRAEQAHTGHGGEHPHAPLASLPPDTRQYHDMTATSGTIYVFMVAAENAVGESEPDETSVVAP